MLSKTRKSNVRSLSLTPWYLCHLILFFASWHVCQSCSDHKECESCLDDGCVWSTGECVDLYENVTNVEVCQQEVDSMTDNEACQSETIASCKECTETSWPSDPSQNCMWHKWYYHPGGGYCTRERPYWWSTNGVTDSDQCSVGILCEIVGSIFPQQGNF